MFRFLITADKMQYQGVYASSCDALIDAMDRFPLAGRLSVRAL